ncbi:MAG TPA: HD domain-containing protein [Acidobacteriaceae bacterium]
MAGDFSRARAWTLLKEYTASSSLLKHALGVESCVAAWGERQTQVLGLGTAESAALVERYAVTGLLHDFDYERHPDQHPYLGVRLLEEQGWPEEIRSAILGHAHYTGVKRETHLARALFACDELSGLLTACALVKPSRSIADVDVASVRKKMKDKAFARGVSREDILLGASELEVELDEQIAFCLRAMQARAAELGLAGRAEE